MLRTAWLTILIFLVVACSSGTPDTSLPTESTDLFLVELSAADGLPAADPVNLTDREGYDNQPAFLADGTAILYASARESQVDIWRYDLADGTSRQLTDTAEREYSPTPLLDGGGFSTVRVESDGQQRLWRFDKEGHTPELLLDWEDRVGYHSWIDEQLVALHIVDEPSELLFADVTVGWAEHRPVTQDVGRCLRRIPGRNALSFVQTDNPSESWVIELDLLTRELRPLVRSLPGSEDFAWMPDGTLLMASGSQLFAWHAGRNADWELRADFADRGLSEITRLAVSPAGDRLVLVAARSPTD